MKVQLSLLGKTYKNYEVFKHVLLIIKSILYNFDHLIFSIFAYIICNQIKLNENMKLLIMTFITGCLCIWFECAAKGSSFVKTYALAILGRIAVKLARPISHHMQKAVKRTIIFIKYWFWFSQSLDEGGVRFAWLRLEQCIGTIASQTEAAMTAYLRVTPCSCFNSF